MEKADDPKYRRYRINLARREEARKRGRMYVAKGYILRSDTNSGPHVYDPDVVGCYVYFRTQKVGWQLAQVVGLRENAAMQSRSSAYLANDEFGKAV